VIEANEAANAKIDDEKQKRLDKLNKARFAAIMARYNAGKKLDEDRRKREEKERVAQAALDAAGDKAILTARAKAEIDLIKSNAAYEKKQRELDAAGDKAILENQAKAELELNRANDAYEKMSDAERQKRLDELNDKVEEMAERLSIPFAAALSLIRQAKEEATVGLDAFGGPGSFKYGGSQTFTPDPDKTKKTQKSDLQILREQLDLEDALLGKTEARQRVIQALGVKFVENNPKTVAGLEEQINKNLELVRVEQERIDLANTISSAMENSLMSMVDGTKSVKDAFRDMARDIIAHLYKVMVVQQMVNALGGFMSGSSNATIAQIGGELQSYDNGGYTGNGPRSGGLDGKGGFMAMLHPRETVIDHTKGQSGGQVVVNQVINVTTGVQQTVRAEIMGLMPQIQEASKAAVLDAKRRGGSFAGAF
jgi:hypothetical protein